MCFGADFKVSGCQCCHRIIIRYIGLEFSYVLGVFQPISANLLIFKAYFHGICWTNWKLGNVVPRILYLFEKGISCLLLEPIGLLISQGYVYIFHI